MGYIYDSLQTHMTNLFLETFKISENMNDIYSLLSFSNDYMAFQVFDNEGDGSGNDINHSWFIAYRSIIKSRSTFLATMLQSDMKEARSNIVVVKDCKYSVFKAFLFYLYTGDKSKLYIIFI
jgi:hypothetical protein